MTESKDISTIIGDVKFNFRVGVIFEYDGKVLVEKGEVGHTVIPGGRVKTLEDVKSALIREIKEEMHYDISKKEITLQNIIQNFFKINDTKYHELYFVYRVYLNEDDEIVNRSKEELVNYDSDINRYEFVDIDKVDNETMKPDILKQVIKNKEFGTLIVREF